MLWKTFSESGQVQSDEIVQQFRERLVNRCLLSGCAPQPCSLVLLASGLRLNFMGGYCARIAAVAEKVNNCFSAEVARSSIHPVIVPGIVHP